VESLLCYGNVCKLGRWKFSCLFSNNIYLENNLFYVIYFYKIAFLFPFGAHGRETGYDSTILSYLNLLFGAPIRKDNLNLLLFLSY
jgi:hypothetical protein